MLSTSFAGHHLLSLVPATTNTPWAGAGWCKLNQSGTHKHVGFFCLTKGKIKQVRRKQLNEGFGNGTFFEIHHVKHGSINYNKPTQSSCCIRLRITSLGLCNVLLLDWRNAHEQLVSSFRENRYSCYSRLTTVDPLVTVLVSSSMQRQLNSQPQLTRKKDQKRQGAPRHRKGYKKCLKFRCAQHDSMVDNPVRNLFWCVHTRTWCWRNVISAQYSECQLKATFRSSLLLRPALKPPRGAHIAMGARRNKSSLIASLL